LDVDEYFDRLDQAFASLQPSPLPAAPDAASEPEPATGGGTNDWFGGGASSAAPVVPASSGSPSSGFDTFSSAGSSFDAPAAEAAMPSISWGPEPPGAAPTPHEPEPDVSSQAESITTPAEVSVASGRWEPEVERTPEPLFSSPPASDPLPSAAPTASLSGPAVSLPPLEDAFAALLAAEQGLPQPSAVPTWHAAAVAPAVPSEEIIEQVTRLVLERLSDEVVRETVGRIVADVAERLIREEIERIKSNIK
jgi:hypothetical protein